MSRALRPLLPFTLSRAPPVALTTALLAALPTAIGPALPALAAAGPQERPEPPPPPPAPSTPAPQPPDGEGQVPVPLPESPDDRRFQTTPLTTGTRPQDVPTTTPVPVDPGPDGDAPDPRPPVPAPELQQQPGDPDTDAAAVPTLTATGAELLIGRRVVDRTGKAVGRVRDFLSAGTDARMLYVLIGRGGLMGMGETLVAVPIEALSVDPRAVARTDSPLQLSYTAAELKGMPAFTYGADDRSSLRPLVGPRS